MSEDDLHDLSGFNFVDEVFFDAWLQQFLNFFICVLWGRDHHQVFWFVNFWLIVLCHIFLDFVKTLYTIHIEIQHQDCQRPCWQCFSADYAHINCLENVFEHFIWICKNWQVVTYPIPFKLSDHPCDQSLILLANYDPRELLLSPRLTVKWIIAVTIDSRSWEIKRFFVSVLNSW